MTNSEFMQGLAQDHIQSYLPSELKRTRLNVLCFMEALAERHGGMPGGRRTFHKLRTTSAHGNNASGRRSGGSSLTDSESGKPNTGLPPPSPYSSVDSPRVQDRYLRARLDSRQRSFRLNPQLYVDNDDLR